MHFPIHHTQPSTNTFITTTMGIQNNKVYKLSNGVEIPAVGFGTFASEGSKGETYRAVTKALEVGYRHLDCAWFYQNEDEVGDAVRDFLKANPSVTRKDLFICTKVWNHLQSYLYFIRLIVTILGAEEFKIYIIIYKI